MHYSGFFQNNWEVTEILADKIRSWVNSASPKAFFDLYAGVGTFTFLCADQVENIYAIEESRQASAALEMNAKESSRRIKIVQGRVESAFPKVWGSVATKDAVIFVDPPRTGMEKSLTDFLAEKVQAKALIYVSCDPATLARDLKILVSSGNWQVEEVVPFDMFPRTKHVEAAALLYYNPTT